MQALHVAKKLAALDAEAPVALWGGRPSLVEALSGDGVSGVFRDAVRDATPDALLALAFAAPWIAGETIVAMRDHAAQSADPAMKGLATLSLVPRAVVPLLAERGAG